ncbi:MAG: sigma-70 family RNA polymerase sigma factor [Rhodospirillaceae bacterium]|nr:sigma-70 family RNA polymerase sigma factor [Rhodospirillaceae bacterium]
MKQTSTRDTCNISETELLVVLPHLRAFAIFLARNRDRADDLVQETIVRAMTASASFQPGTNLKAWMFTILRNAFYYELREGLRMQSLDASPMLEPHSPGSQEACLEYGDFRRAFWQLTDDKREVLILVGASGLTYKEGAEVCGCAIGTIKSRVSRARRDLRRILDNDLLDGKRRDTPALAA